MLVLPRFYQSNRHYPHSLLRLQLPANFKSPATRNPCPTPTTLCPLRSPFRPTGFIPAMKTSTFSLAIFLFVAGCSTLGTIAADTATIALHTATTEPALQAGQAIATVASTTYPWLQPMLIVIGSAATAIAGMIAHSKLNKSNASK